MLYVAAQRFVDVGYNALLPAVSQQLVRAEGTQRSSSAVMEYDRVNFFFMTRYLSSVSIDVRAQIRGTLAAVQSLYCSRVAVFATAFSWSFIAWILFGFRSWVNLTRTRICWTMMMLLQPAMKSSRLRRRLFYRVGLWIRLSSSPIPLPLRRGLESPRSTLNKETIHFIQSVMERYHEAMLQDTTHRFNWSKRLHQAIKALHEVLTYVELLQASPSTEQKEFSLNVQCRSCWMPLG